MGDATSTHISLGNASVAPYTPGEKMYINTVKKLENLFSPAEDYFHNVALRVDAGVDGIKKNKNIKRKSKTSKMVKGVKFAATPAATMSKKEKAMGKIANFVKANNIAPIAIVPMKKKKATPKAAGPRVKKYGPRKKYTKSQKFLEYHAKRSQRAHDKKLHKYIGTARGLGKANEVKRLRNKLAWCKKYATAIENKVKL